MLQSKKFEDFQKEASQFKNILLEYKKTGKPYVDNNFHPIHKIEESKIYIDDSLKSWVRVDEMYKAPLFQENLIQADYIKQGELGDCYLLASFSRIAKQSDLIPSFFDTSTPNRILGKIHNSINIKCGAVVIYFNCFGSRTPVLIDTLLPIKYGKLRFSKPSDINVSPWFCLVEKAYAKLHGSYSNIISGTLPHAIYNMFGYYSSNKNFPKLRDSEKVTDSQLFEKILKYHQKGAVMGTSISYSDLPKNVTKEEVEGKGLVANHCYLIVKAQKVFDKNFLCLRNPWGDHEWNGDWSDNSPLWTPQLEKELKMVKADDGTFWMIDKDFFRYFTDLDVSKPFLNKMYSKRFYYKLVPGDHDGTQPTDKRANFTSRPNFVFQVTDPISKSEKCRLHILVERHHELFDKKRNVVYSSPSYCVYLVRNGGKKIDYDESRYCRRSMFVSSSNLFHSSYDINGNDDIVTIVLHRLQKCNLIEDCYVLVFCDHEFNLYDLDHPEKTIEYEQNQGIVLDNFSSSYNKKQIKLKSNTNNLPIAQSNRANLNTIPNQNNIIRKTDINDNVINNDRKKFKKDIINNSDISYSEKGKEYNSARNNDNDDLKSKLQAKNQEIKKMNEKMKIEIQARLKAEEDARNANTEIEHLKSLLEKSQKQIRDREIEDSKNDKIQKELNQKLNEVNQMKREIEKEKKMINIEKQRIQSEKNKHQHHHRHQYNEEIRNDGDSISSHRIKKHRHSPSQTNESINIQENDLSKQKFNKENSNENNNSILYNRNSKTNRNIELSTQNDFTEIKSNKESPISSHRKMHSHSPSQTNELINIQENSLSKQRFNKENSNENNNFILYNRNSRTNRNIELSTQNDFTEIKSNKESPISSHRKMYCHSPNQTNESINKIENNLNKQKYIKENSNENINSYLRNKNSLKNDNHEMFKSNKLREINENKTNKKQIIDDDNMISKNKKNPLKSASSNSSVYHISRTNSKQINKGSYYKESANVNRSLNNNKRGQSPPSNLRLLPSSLCMQLKVNLGPKMSYNSKQIKANSTKSKLKGRSKSAPKKIRF